MAHLKGGDPLLYGRGAEEIQFLRAAGIAYEIVPGITAAVAAAAYAELPLTRRRRASSVALCTGHTDEVVVPEADTLVYYMAAARLGEVARRVLAHGRAPDTPVALVRNASRPEQSVTAVTLAEAAGLPAPAPPLVAVIGPGGAPLAGALDAAAAEVIAARGLPAPVPARPPEVAATAGAASGTVSLPDSAAAPGAGVGTAGVTECGVQHGVRTGRRAGGVGPRAASAAPGGPVQTTDRAAGAEPSDCRAARTGSAPGIRTWFASASKVLVTGTSAEPYRHLGEVVHTPLIEISDPEDWRPLDAAAAALASYSLVVFTSRFAVAALLERLLAGGGDARRLAHARLAAIGRATAAALRGRGLAADVTAAREHTDGLLDALARAGPLGSERVLLPSSALADDRLPDALRAAGAEVTAVTAYRNFPVPDPVRVDLAALDAVLFTSPSTVAAFRGLYGGQVPPALALWCRGPRTRAAAHAAFGRGDRLPGRQGQAFAPEARPVD